MRRNEAPAVAPDRDGRAPALPVLLADRQGVAFVATARGVESLRVPRRYWGMQVGVVPIPSSDEEIRATDLSPAGDAGVWPAVVPRPDLLAPALSRLLSGDHLELSLQPSRDGLKAMLITAHDEQQAFPIAPKDTLGFLAAVFSHAPRGVVRTGVGKPPRVVLSVRPAVHRHDFRLRLAGVLGGAPPGTLSDIGLSPALLELLLEALDRTAAMLLVSGGPTSGRSTTLDLLAATLMARGHRGGWVGSRRDDRRPELVWLADALADWPFPETLHASAPEFVVVERLESPGDLVLAARLASSGRLVLAGAPTAEPEALARSAARELETGSAPAVPIAVLGQSLIRTICRGCVTWRALPPEQVRRHRFHRRDAEEFEQRGGLAVALGRGCNDCAGTGFSGLTGVFEYVGPENAGGSLPKMREDGWRRVLQGVASYEDVSALPGAHRPMRTLREIMVHAGLTPTPLEAAPQGAPVGSATDIPAVRPVAAAGSSPALSESDDLTRLFREARRSGSIDPQALAPLARAIAARGGGTEPLQSLLAPVKGFHLARHAVNTALIATRIASGLVGEIDLEEVARLALLHDLGLVGADVDPGATLPPVASEEALDPTGRRTDAASVTRFLSQSDRAAELADPIVQVHALLGFDTPTVQGRARSDGRVQVVALAALIDLLFHGPRTETHHDLNDITSIVMEQHGRRFNPALFRALLRAIPIFPIGALVELSSGDLARVVSLNEDNHFRPRVEISTASGGEGLAERRIVDLARAPFLHIRQRVSGLAQGANAA
jgi:hypothetical protein